MTDLPLAYRINKVHEVAPWGRSTTYTLVREGLLPARRLGGSTFVLREDLEAFVKTLEPVHKSSAATALI